jgi:hypothetical protein
MKLQNKLAKSRNLIPVSFIYQGLRYMYNLETVSDELCLFGVINVHFNEEIFVPI